MGATTWKISKIIVWKERNQTREYKLYGFICKNSRNYKITQRTTE